MVKKRNKAFVVVMSVYSVLIIATLVTMIRGIVLSSMKDVLFCTLVLLEYPAVYFIFRRPKLNFPAALEITLLIFMFASQILAQVFELMRIISYWDIILHTTSGFLLGVAGVFLISVFNRKSGGLTKMSAAFILFVAFSFSMMTAVIWEFGERSLDVILNADMQKDTVTRTVISEMLNPDNSKPAMEVENITETVIYGTVNGEETAITVNGYLDIGLIDTLEDMFVHFLGTTVFIIILGLDIKKGKGRFMRGFVPQMLADEEYVTASAD